MDITLHYAPDNASLAVRMALEIAELPYQACLVDRAGREQESDRYRALNPMGLIPVAVIDGVAVFETAAILSALAKRAPKLAPNANPDQAQSWLFWLSNTLHPLERMIFYPEKYMPGARDDFRRAMRKKLGQTCGWLDQHAPSWLLEGVHIHAAYLAVLLRWPAIYGLADNELEEEKFSLDQWPRLYEFACRFEAIPAVMRACFAEGIGEFSFSSPTYPNPPEGSAT